MPTSSLFFFIYGGQDITPVKSEEATVPACLPSGADDNAIALAVYAHKGPACTYLTSSNNGRSVASVASQVRTVASERACGMAPAQPAAKDR